MPSEKRENEIYESSVNWKKYKGDKSINNSPKRKRFGNSDMDPVDEIYPGATVTDQDIFDAIDKKKDTRRVAHFAKLSSNLCQQLNRFGYCPLAFAVCKGKPEIIEYLVKEYSKMEAFGRFGKNPLSQAVLQRDIGTINLLLNNESKFGYVNYIDESGVSPLILAVEGRSKKFVEHLLSKGAHVAKTMKDGKTALSVAVQYQNVEIVSLLLNHGAKVTSQSAFFKAIEKGNFQIVKLLKEAGALVNFTYKNGYTPLQKAIETGNASIIEYLVENGAVVGQDIKDDDKLLLFKYVSKGNHGMVTFLSKHVVNLDKIEVDASDYTPLTKAVDMKDFKMAQILIDNGASVNRCDNKERYPLALAVLNGSSNIADYLVQHGADFNLVKPEFEKYHQNLIMKFINEKDHQMVTILLKNGENPDKEDDPSGYTLLTKAAETGNLEMVKALVDNGATVNKYDSKNRYPLALAISSGSFDTAKYLMDTGADINLVKTDLDTDHQNLLIRRLIPERNYQMVTMLLENGISVDKGDSSGYTLLTKAVESEDIQMVKLLLEKGASINKSDGNNKYPLTVAITNGLLDIIEYLIDSGADTSLAEAEIKEYSTLSDDFNAFVQKKGLNMAQNGEGQGDHQ